MEGRGIADLISVEMIHAGTPQEHRGYRFPALMLIVPWFCTHELLLRSLMLAHDPNQAAQNKYGEFISATPIVNRLRAVAREHDLDDTLLDDLQWPELWM